jgi:mannan endo-1,6-alpha-mannosidase
LLFRKYTHLFALIIIIQLLFSPILCILSRPETAVATMKTSLSIKAAVLATISANGVFAESPFSLDSLDSVKQTASILSWDAMQYYKGNLTGEIPGILPGPPPNGDYYWWNGAALWASLIDYWHYTGDSTYNHVTMEALLFQIGEMQDYLPHNQSVSVGNDDQGMWAFASMLAAERGFPNPPMDQPQWLQLAENVFNSMADRWDDDGVCDGGLRWMISFTSSGYDYANSEF